MTNIATREDILNMSASDFLEKNKDRMSQYTRLQNFITKAEVATVRDLCKYSRGAILKFRNLGNLCVTQLQDTLRAYGLSLSHFYPYEPNNRVEELKKELMKKIIPEVENIIDKIIRTINNEIV